MRRVVAVALVVVVALAAPAAWADDGEPPVLEDALAQAAREGKPLLVELGAPWCGPCRELAAVMSDPDVVAARAKVVMVEYDVDTPLGAAVARRFGTRGVPALIAVDGRGQAYVRQEGVGGDGREALARWFVSFVTHDVLGGGALPALQTRVAARPDLAAQLELARRYHELGRTDEALAAFVAVAEAEPRTADERALVATAAAARAELEGAQERTEQALAEAARFVERHPAAPEALPRVALLVVAGRLGEGSLDRLLERARRGGAPPLAVLRLALLGGRWELAARLVDTIGGGDRTLAAAELDLARGRPEAARRRLAAVCGGPRPRHPARCWSLERALAGSASPARALRFEAERTLDELTSPGQGARQWRAATDLGDDELGDAVATALRGARAACAGERGSRTLFVELRLAREGGRPRVLVEPAADDAADCVRARLAATELPAPPAGRSAVSTSLDLRPPADAERRLTRPRRPGFAPEPPSEPLGRGALLFLSQRLGAIDDLGVGIHALSDRGAAGSGRVVVGGELEAGVDRGGHGTFAARALVGLGVNARSGGGVVLLTGLGASAAGPAAPAALEVPVELRLRAPGPRRVQLWIRSRVVLGEPARDLVDTDAIPVGDSLGAGVSLRAVGRATLGAAIDRDAAGVTAAVQLGVSLGDVY